MRSIQILTIQWPAIIPTSRCVTLCTLLQVYGRVKHTLEQKEEAVTRRLVDLEETVNDIAVGTNFVCTYIDCKASSSLTGLAIVLVSFVLSSNLTCHSTCKNVNPPYRRRVKPINIKGFPIKFRIVLFQL